MEDFLSLPATFLILPLLKITNQLFCGKSISVFLYDHDLDYVYLTGISQKQCCILIASHQVHIISNVPLLRMFTLVP